MISSFNLCCAQQDLNGYWKGKITQEDGGYTPEYLFELFIIQKGDSITGRSYVSIDSIYADISYRLLELSCRHRNSRKLYGLLQI